MNRHRRVAHTPRPAVLALTLALLAQAALALPAGAEPAAAPALLHGKSFVVSWSEDRVQRHVGEPNFRPVRASQTMSIYVSAAGRVFSRLNFATPAGTGAAERVQGDMEKNPLFRQWQPTFRDSSMSLSQPFHKGAKRLLEIEFDSALKGCNAKVSYVPDDPDKASQGWSPVTKKMVEFRSIAMTGESCAVRSGNVFQGG